MSELSERVLGAAIGVHKQLGAVLLESTHERCFSQELSLRGLLNQRKKSLGYLLNFTVTKIKDGRQRIVQKPQRSMPTLRRLAKHSRCALRFLCG